MNIYQTIAILLLAIFFIVYLLKNLSQARKGITSNQMGKGIKNKKLKTIETFLKVFSFLIVIVEIISILFNTVYLPQLGLFLVACGVCVFILAIYTMKDSWRAGIAIEDDTSLITNGIYKYSRNPAFLGFDLVYIGILIAFFNLALFIVTIITVIIFHLQILEEEKYLSEAFGNDYLKYKSQVGRYFIL